MDHAPGAALVTSQDHILGRMVCNTEGDLFYSSLPLICPESEERVLLPPRPDFGSDLTRFPFAEQELKRMRG